MTQAITAANALAKEIRESVGNSSPVQTQLATSQRVIARITDGIYREPWAAFRELVANAYDADATEVIVETGAPAFDQIVVRDNGRGMTPDVVAYVLRNIGGSLKRTSTGATLQTVDSGDPDKSPNGRPLIGKIGIGLFAVAQLTQHFQIITQAAGERIRTSATVRLHTHDEHKTAAAVDEENYVAGSVTIVAEEVPESEKDAHGTSVILYSLRPEVRRSLQSIRRWDAVEDNGPERGFANDEPPDFYIGVEAGLSRTWPNGLESKLPWAPEDSPTKKFERLIDAADISSEKRKRPADLAHFDEYLRLIWQLSLSLPLKYVDEHPFDIAGGTGLMIFEVPVGSTQAQAVPLEPNETVRTRFNLTAGLNDSSGSFVVLIDGVQLSRPIRLPHKLRTKSRVSAPVMMVAKEEAPYKPQDMDRAGGPLRFEAYLYWNSKIIPKDTAGVLLRVREASGTLFDRRFLNYQVSEQNRLGQITAEIFVKDGLDSAINIDRESFNYSHPHYLFIQRWLHKALRLLVNKLKGLADESLQKEKSQQLLVQTQVLQARAARVWVERQGDSADPPVQNTSAPFPEEVGGISIEWPAGGPRGDPPLASAIAVVLEAYGVLSNLNARDRSRLINDLLNLMKPHNDD